MTASAAGARLSVVPGAGHLLPLDHWADAVDY
jgi:pimeloyl-ACP methyl ester carboxylesterase